MTAITLLDRLDGVKRCGPGRWVARCPAHEDRRPSLSVRELDDGRVLAHCFGGCDVQSVLGAVGLSFEALFPPREIEHGRPVKRPWNAAQLLHLLDHESLVVFAACADKAKRGALSEADLQRMSLARDRLTVIVGELPR